MGSAGWGAFLVLLCAAFAGAPVHAQSSPFTNCPAEPNADNATVRLLETVSVEFPDGTTQFSTGDEIAFFTNDDVCAGRTIWDDSNPDSRVLSISGPPGAVGSEVDGYANDEPLQLSVWQASTDRRFDVAPSDIGYTPCDGSDPLCRDDGRYESDVIFTVEAVGSGVLPVELSSFALRLRGNRAQAIWRTLSETNNSGFTIQHRRDTTHTWQALGFVPGRGTTTTPHRYNFTTDPLAYGAHHFRLLQHDHDGTTTEIANQAVVHRLTEMPLVLSIAPQPVRSQATLTLTTATAQPTRVDLFDLLGRHVQLLHHGPLSPSTPHTIMLNTAGLSSGQYIVRVQSGSDRLTRRVVVLR
ncbi:T9SS type A sorting domain-containing protein [Longimonas halophila]|nr:T9SS type A sorting domain-containing protein [Longimonas halophila]